MCDSLHHIGFGFISLAEMINQWKLVACFMSYINYSASKVERLIFVFSASVKSRPDSQNQSLETDCD